MTDEEYDAWMDKYVGGTDWYPRSLAYQLFLTDEEISDRGSGYDFMYHHLLGVRRAVKSFTQTEAEWMEGTRYQSPHFDVEDVQPIRDVPIEQVIMQKIRRMGTKKVTHCVFHNEKTPSCVIYDKSFYCFGCGKSGNAIDWVMQEQQCSFNQSVSYIKQRM